jgi:DNA-binding MarR family transcriptional regulator
MAGENLQQLFSELNRETRLNSSLSVLFSQAVADDLGVHSTDIETLDLLHLLGPMTAGHLSEVTGLSTGATTRLIDRLERQGFARRTTDQSDRRRVVVEARTENAERVLPLFAAMGKRLGELWASYDAGELAVVLDFMKKTNAILAEENARLRGRRND